MKSNAAIAVLMLAVIAVVARGCGPNGEGGKVASRTTASSASVTLGDLAIRLPRGWSTVPGASPLRLHNRNHTEVIVVEQVVASAVAVRDVAKQAAAETPHRKAGHIRIVGSDHGQRVAVRFHVTQPVPSAVEQMWWRTGARDVIVTWAGPPDARAPHMAISRLTAPGAGE